VNRLKKLTMSLIIPLFLMAAGMHLPGVGSKAIAMGGAFRAVADDATALYWNPAGIGQLDKSQLYLCGHLIYNDFSFQPADTLLDIAHVMRDTENEMQKKAFYLGHLFYTTPIGKSKKLNLGLGIYSQLGVGSYWDVMKDNDLDYVTTLRFFGSDFEITTTETLPELDFTGEIGAYTANPVIEYDFSDKLSVGIGAMITYSLFEVAIPSMDSVRMEADTGLIFQRAEMDGYSFGVNAGAIYKPIPKIAFALTGKWESPLEYEGQYSADIYRFYNEYLSSFLQGGLTEGDNIDASTSLPRPLRMGMGISYLPVDQLTLSLDLSYTNWSVIDSIDLLQTESDSVLERLVLKWKNSYRIALGAEYRVKNYSFRAGVFYEPHPAVQEYQNLLLPDMNDMIAISGGIGVQFDNIELELSADCEYFPDKEIEDNWEDNQMVNIPGIYGGYVGDLSLSIIYNF